MCVPRILFNEERTSSTTCEKDNVKKRVKATMYIESSLCRFYFMVRSAGR